MNRLSIIGYLQDPTVIGYLQVADTHCWRYGVPRPNLTFHPTTRYALQLYLHGLRHKHLHLHQHVHVTPGTHSRVQVHTTARYALQVYLHWLRHKHLQLHQHVHMTHGTHSRVQVHTRTHLRVHMFTYSR